MGFAFGRKPDHETLCKALLQGACRSGVCIAAAPGCPCRVPLQDAAAGCCFKVLFALWNLVGGAVQGAAAGCCFEGAELKCCMRFRTGCWCYRVPLQPLHGAAGESAVCALELGVKSSMYRSTASNANEI